MPTYVLSNPKVMQQKKTFTDEVTASNAKQAAQKLFGSLVERMHNLEKVDMLISFYKKDSEQKTFNYHCSKANVDNDSKVTVKSYKIPKKAVSAGAWGEQAGGGDGDGFRTKYKKHMEKKHSKKDDDSDSDSDSDLDSYVEPVFFIYDPFYYGNYLYSSYVLNRSILLGNFLYNFSGFWYW